MRSIIIFISLVFCTSFFTQKNNSYYCHWRDNKIDNIKLLSQDFKYSEKGKFYYYLSNNRDNIYIDLRIFDNDVQRQILHSGLTIWINMNGKKTRKTGVKYPVSTKDYGNPDIQNMQRFQNKTYNQNRQDSQNMKNMSKSESFPSRNMEIQLPPVNTMELIGLSGSGLMLISSFEINNFRGSVNFEKDGNMWYEVVMPLSKLPSLNHKDRNGAYSFILGFEYSGMSSFSPGGGPGGGSMGGGMRGSGGPGGGPGGGSMSRGMRGGAGPGAGGPGGPAGGGMGISPGSSSDSKTIFWLKNISLAVEK